MAGVGIGEIQRIFRQTFTKEGRLEKQHEAEMKTYQAALSQFNQALAPFENRMRALHSERGLALMPNRKESFTAGEAPYTNGKTIYSDLRIAHTNGAYVFTATRDVDDWIKLSSGKREHDGRPRTYTNRYRRVRRDVLTMDENTGEIISAQSGQNFSKISRFTEIFLRIKYPSKFQNAKGCVDSLQLKPMETISEQTAAVKRVTELLQKASAQKKKKK
ncbi:MAG: hypothetical protein WA061_06410 [Microgenomates group bacterium]